MNLLKTATALAFCAGVAACTTFDPAYTQSSLDNTPLDEFGTSDAYSQAFPGNADASCEAARRALLSQGYVLDLAQPSELKAHKSFQPQHDVHTEVKFNVTCATNTRGSNTATVFVNAVRDRYALRKNTNSASVGFSALGSVSLPFSASADALVKVGSETISKDSFYRRFFALLERHLDYKQTERSPDTAETDSVDGE